MYELRIKGETHQEIRQKLKLAFEEEFGALAADPMDQGSATIETFRTTEETIRDSIAKGPRAGSTMNPAFRVFEDPALKSPATVDLAKTVFTETYDPTPDRVVQSTTPSFTPTVSNASVAGQKDVRGLPHDVRIHSAEGTKNADGSWRNRRGVDKELLKTVETELKASSVLPSAVSNPVGNDVSGIRQPAPPSLEPTPQFVTPPPPAPTIAVHTPPVQQVAPPQAAPVEPVKTYENVTIPAGVKPAHSLATFKNNLNLILAQFISEKKINQEWIKSVVDYFKTKDPNFKEIWNIVGNELFAMELFAMFVDGGMITKIEG